jgi:hypothetical protein
MGTPGTPFSLDSGCVQPRERRFRTGALTMMRTFTALLAAFAFAAATLTPAAADARDRRGHGGYDGRGHHGRHYRDRDNSDEVAAGVLGLVLGVAVGSMLAQPREPRVQCYDNYRRCPPPPPRDYYERGYRDQGYDRRYDDDRSAYEQEYGFEGGPYAEGDYDPYVERAPQCTRRERQWDRYANRYVTVDVPC